MTTTLPPLAGWTEYGEALAKRDRLAADLRQAQRDLDALPSAEAAAKADEDQAAAALLEGKAAPRTRAATDRRKADLETGRHRVRALANALEQQHESCRALIRDERETAQQAARDALADSAARYRTATEDLTDAREDFHAARAVVAWVESDLSDRWKDRPAPPLAVPGAMTANGEPLPFDRVLEALGTEAGEGPRLVPGPWRGTWIKAEDRVRIVRKVVPDYLADTTGRTHSVVLVRADEVEALDRRIAANRMARERANDELAAAEYAQKERVSHRDAAGLPTPLTPGDPLADLRDPTDA